MRRDSGCRYPEVGQRYQAIPVNNVQRATKPIPVKQFFGRGCMRSIGALALSGPNTDPADLRVSPATRSRTKQLSREGGLRHRS